MKITRNHLDEIPEGAYCARGARRWFEYVGLDWSDFLKNGIDSDILVATGDAMAIRLVEFVKEKYGGK